MRSPRRVAWRRTCAARRPNAYIPGMLRMLRRSAPTPDVLWPAQASGITSRMVTLANGLAVRVVEAGPAGGPPVVLVHGWACTAFAWRRQVPVLAAAGRRVVAFDLKGHGFSDKPTLAAEYSAPAMTRFVLDVMDATG